VPEAKKSKDKKDVPSVEEIRKVLEYLQGPKMMSLYKALSAGSITALYKLLATRSLSSGHYLLEVRRAITRTKRGKGEYERFYIDIPIAVQRAMRLEEGSIVEIRKYHKRR